MTIVINLYGGPGTGKSTTAAGLFYHLKQAGSNVEMVREYAKVVVWEGRLHMLSDQIYIFAKQRKLMRDLNGKVDFIITDSPLLMSLLYGRDESETFKTLVKEEYEKWDNVDVLLDRVKDYNSAGRVQTLDEAITLDDEIRRIFHDVVRDGDHLVLPADGEAVNDIFGTLKEWYPVGVLS